MDKESVRYLLEQYMHGQLTDAMAAELLELTRNGKDAEILDVLKELMVMESLLAGPIDLERAMASLRKILEVDNSRPDKPVLRVRRISPWWAAAAVVLLLGAGGWLLVLHRPVHQQTRTEDADPLTKINVPAPEGTKTTLTLGNGTTVILDSVRTGRLARQGNAAVVKKKDNQLSYDALSGIGSNNPVYNTLTTARGGQAVVLLADGTKVWLNALSSLTFPTVFTGKERKVTLTGEAYFEVKENSRIPFRVYTGDVSVDVLGTHFDIMAYADESSVQTTLLEGAVKVTRGNASGILKPGEQAFMDRSGGAIRVLKDVDPGAAVAWKDGFFEFDRLKVDDILRQVARWYDVDISSEGGAVNRSFSGVVSRKSNFSEVLKIMQRAHIRFRVEGKKIILTQ